MADPLIHEIPTTATSFASDDYIVLDGVANGTRNMTQANLKNSVVAGNLAPLFDPTRTSENPYKVGDCVIYNGRLYRFVKTHYGPWATGDAFPSSGMKDLNAFINDSVIRGKIELGFSIHDCYISILDYSFVDRADYDTNLYKLNNVGLISITARIGPLTGIIFYDEQFSVVKVINGRTVDIGANFNNNPIIVPANAKYMFVSYHIDYDCNVKSFSDMVIDAADSYIQPIITEVLTDCYITPSGSLVQRSQYKTYRIYLSSISKLFIRARIGPGTCVIFYDDQYQIVEVVPGRPVDSNDLTKINFDEFLDVPTGSIYAKFSSGTEAETYLDSYEFLRRVPSNSDKFLKGKKVVFIGDSITAGSGASGESGRYVNQFGVITGATVVNLGVGGTCIANNTKNGLSANRFVTRATAQNLSDADLVVVFGGTNDVSYDSKAIGDHFTVTTIAAYENIGTKQLGPVSDTDTFAGALHELITTIQANVAEYTPILFLTPLHRDHFLSKNPNSYQCNSNGDFMKDFVDAIKDICGFYAIPVLDMYSDAELNPLVPNYASAFPDGLHPNDTGHKVIAERISKFVKNNISFIDDE